VKDFFKILKNLKDQGATIIFVTHKLKEVLNICDRITVLRAGMVSGVIGAKESTPQILARMMVGRDIVFTLKKRKVTPKEELLEVKGFCVRNDKGILSVNNLSFVLRASEILGIAGVEGNGQTELVEALTGLRDIEGGDLRLMGKKISKVEPNMARRLGIAYIPSDKDVGLIDDLSVAENLILGFQSAKPYNERLGMNSKVISKFAKRTIEAFNIATPNEKARVRYLSGGNQQRVVVARELTHNPKIILAAQPTRGLDVASTEYVRTALLKMREAGKGVLLVTTDLDEALQLSDRLAIIYRGTFMDVVKPGEVTEEQLGLLMGGQSIK
jgi:simple sugar transport system ATP-binding protein